MKELIINIAIVMFTVGVMTLAVYNIMTCWNVPIAKAPARCLMR